MWSYAVNTHTWAVRCCYLKRKGAVVFTNIVISSLAHTHRSTDENRHSCNESPTHCDRNFEFYHTQIDWLRCSAMRSDILPTGFMWKYTCFLTTSVLRQQFFFVTSFHKTFFHESKIRIHTVAVSRSHGRKSAHTARFTATATRFDMFIPVAVSLQPSPTVAARRKGITHQPIPCN